MVLSLAKPYQEKDQQATWGYLVQCDSYRSVNETPAVIIIIIIHQALLRFSVNENLNLGNL